MTVCLFVPLPEDFAPVPSRSDFAFFASFRVRYNETDAQGVVFYGNYLIYYDVSLNEFLRWLGYDYKNQPKHTGTDFHVVKASAEYAAPLRFEDEFEVGVRISRIGRASIAFETALFPKGAETPSATGEIVWVNADQSTGKSAPVPETLRMLVEAKAAPAPASSG
jgi:acyl-CoA thioester hydrolase